MQIEQPLSWFDPDVTPESPTDYGWVLTEEMPELEICKDHLLGILEAVYDGKLDQLENSIEELCHQLKVPFPGHKQSKLGVV